MQLKSKAGHRLRDIVGAKLTKRQLSIQFIVAVLNRRVAFCGGRKRRPMGSEVRECNKIYSSVEAERSGRSSVSSLAALLGVRGFIIRERTGFASIPYYFCVYETKLLIYFFSLLLFSLPHQTF